MQIVEKWVVVTAQLAWGKISYQRLIGLLELSIMTKEVEVLAAGEA